LNRNRCIYLLDDPVAFRRREEAVDKLRAVLSNQLQWVCELWISMDPSTSKPKTKRLCNVVLGKR
jgi:hypothetical protein